MKDIKEIFIMICYKEGLSMTDITNLYNKKYNDNMQAQVFRRMINNNNIKYNMLCNVLDSIGYSIDIIKNYKEMCIYKNLIDSI
ncbi:hypothetical protein [Megamonas funiformis]|uniref:hypothetical protein n=1 Tax=Megamonas funiformis TaxID=437897 RepID=UPI00241E4E0C|nr:hypothetical protein [Megamonas funiformis]